MVSEILRSDFLEASYLLRGIYDRTVSEPAAYFGELGLVLEPIAMVDGSVCGGLPFEILVALGEPFSGNVCVELDLVGAPVIRSNLYRKEREGDRLVHQICRLC